LDDLFELFSSLQHMEVRMETQHGSRN